jgi:Uri superfamily endonuclease
MLMYDNKKTIVIHWNLNKWKIQVGSYIYMGSYIYT